VAITSRLAKGLLLNIWLWLVVVALAVMQAAALAVIGRL
jgi:hypothetical protein